MSFASSRFRPSPNFIAGTASIDGDLIVSGSITVLGSSSFSGSSETASNLGSGEGTFAQKVGIDLQFKSLVGQGSIAISSDATQIYISSSASGSGGGGSGDVTNAVNVGAGQGIFANKSGSVLQFRSIVASGSIGITSGSDSITIFSTGGGTTFEEYEQIQTASSGQTSFPLTNTPVDVNDIVFYVNGLAYQNGIDFTSTTSAITWLNSPFLMEDGDDIIITYSISGSGGAGEANTASNIGIGQGVFANKSGVDLRFRSLLATGFVSILSGSNEITISGSGAALSHSAQHQDGGFDEMVVSNLLGELSDPQKVRIRKNSGTNIGDRPRLNFLEGPGIVLNVSDDIVNDEIDIEISSSVTASGEANTASNIGSGEGVFANKAGVDLRFRSLLATGSVSLISGSNAITISGTVGGDVFGPSSVTDRVVTIYDGTSGKLIQDSLVTIDISGAIDNNQEKYNGIRFYNKSGVDPSSPTPSDGDRYYNTDMHLEMVYDGYRSKWLSNESIMMPFGRAGTTAQGVFFKGSDVIFTSTNGYTMPFSGTIVAVGYARDDSDAAVFEFLSSGTQIAFISSSATSGTDYTINTNFSTSQTISVRNQSGGNTVTDAQGWFRVRWRR